MNSQRIASVIRQVGAVGAMVVGSLQAANVIPGSYGWVLTLAGTVLLSLEHYVSDPSTGTTAAMSVTPKAAQTPGDLP